LLSFAREETIGIAVKREDPFLVSSRGFTDPMAEVISTEG
jgi:hypothetical protein